MINNWKRQVLEEASNLFEKGNEPAKADACQQAQINELYRQIGQWNSFEQRSTTMVSLV